MIAQLDRDLFGGDPVHLGGVSRASGQAQLGAILAQRVEQALQGPAVRCSPRVRGTPSYTLIMLGSDRFRRCRRIGHRGPAGPQTLQLPLCRDERDERTLVVALGKPLNDVFGLASASDCRRSTQPVEKCGDLATQ